jgi:cytochrome c556
MLRILAAVLFVALATMAVRAQNVAVIKERQEHLEAMGKAVKAPTAMFKGDAEFDLEKVIAGLKTIQEKVRVLPQLFPDDSRTGGDTEALASIWDNKADFEARFQKLGKAAKAAETAITDEFSLMDHWKSVVGNCSGCHKKYRKKKS